jgi:hypothetical protein
MRSGSQCQVVLCSQGYITSDCGAVEDVYDAHHFANTTDATCADVLNAGMVCVAAALRDFDYQLVML